jgi:hypothetical protein
MTFFYDLNKRMAELATKQNLAEGKSAKPDFLDMDKDGDRKEPMKKAVADKDNKKEVDESALQAYLGKKKYGEQGMKALQQAGRDGASKQKMASIRDKHDKMDEAEMDEGNEFSGALARAKALGASEFEVDGKKYQVTSEGFKEMNAYLEKKKKDQGTGKFDKKQISTGTVYTRRHEEEPEDDEDAPVSKGGAPKKKGRKEVGAGKGKKIGAKSRGTSKLASKGSIAENNTMSMVVQATGHAADLINRIQQNGQVEPKELMTKLRAIHSTLSKIQGGSAVTIAEDDIIASVDKGEYDQEGDMAKDQLHTLTKAATELSSILSDDQNLPEWVQSKITKALDYINVANDYMDQERHDSENVVAEKAVSKQQQKFMGMAHAMQKGEKIKGASAELKKVAKTMKKSDVEDFAATKHKDLPKKVKEADAEPKAKKTGGIEFGKGVYESINSQVENMITEGMNVSVNMSTNEHGELTKNITVSAEGDEAETLAQLLNLAGMKSSSCGCGQSPCGCSQVEEAYGDTTPTENAPDYPTDEETTGEDDELLRRWAGGLNKPKSTGQTTVPVVASQQDRLHTMEETKAEKLGMNLYAELKQFKAK